MLLRRRPQQLFYCTLSPRRSVICQEDYPDEDPESLWDAIQYAIFCLWRSGLIEGAIIAEEFAPKTFFPQAAGLPHVHVILVAERVGYEFFGELRRALVNYSGEVQLTATDFLAAQPFPPDTVVDEQFRWVRLEQRKLPCALNSKTYPIRSALDLQKILRYLGKGCDWYTPHNTQWLLNGCMEEPKLRPLFNTDLVNFISAWECFIMKRQKIRGLGCLDGKRRNHFIGVPKAERERAENRAALRAFRAESNAIRDERECDLTLELKPTPIEEVLGIAEYAPRE